MLDWLRKKAKYHAFHGTEADDLVQQACLYLLSHPETPEGHLRMKADIAMRQYRARHGYCRRDNKAHLKLNRTGADLFAVPAAESADGGDVWWDCYQLTAAQRHAADACYGRGLTAAEAAAEVDTCENAIRQRLVQVRRKVAEWRRYARAYREV
jgi:DNA-directed RNA polymerase specialized sigma24 family protein